jgi:hypothetical protein
MHPYIRPGFVMSAIVNPVVGRLGLAPALIVTGRRSGHRLVVPMGQPLDVAGGRYLVSGRGDTHWARNLRVAGRGEFRWHGKTQQFQAIELEGAERARIVAAYRSRLGRRVERYFREIPDPADHPVFRMEPVDTGAHSTSGATR